MSKLHLLCAASCIATLSSSLFSQNLNTTLLQNWTRTSTATSYSDVWGYTAPDGREFAFIGDSAGISILDATDPTNIKSLGFYPVSATSYATRDYTSVGRFIYAVSDYHRGIRVFEIQANGLPKDHGFVQTTTIARAHNIRSDPATGYLYVVEGGVSIFDASQTPTNPKLLARTLGAHDLCVRRGKAYLFAGRDTQILDIRNPLNIQRLGVCSSTGYHHSGWISEDDKILCITHETLNVPVTIWDVTDPTKPSLLSKFRPVTTSSIAHNAYIIGRTMYMSYYIHGFHMVDLADPTKPVKIANYNTSTVTTAGFRGAWGVYPFQDSGVIYVSDMQNGFFAIQVNCGHMNRFGTGTAGTTGVPRARFDGASPKVDAGKLRIEVENLEPSRSFWLVAAAGPAPSPLTLLGAKVHVDLTTAVLVGPITADANGKGSVPVPVPNNPGLGNAKVHFQLFSHRQNGTLTSSRGMWAGICR